MRVVHAKDPDTARDPAGDDVRDRLPQRAPARRRLEVDRVDVLVLLGRILRVPDRSIGPVVEPFRALPDPRMIRRRLQRKVEGHLQAEPPGDADEVFEVLEGAQSRLHGIVAAFRRADRPGTPGIGGPCRKRVVPSLAEAAADRVDRRQVDHVEAHCRNVRQALRGLRKGRASSRVAPGRPREEFVPGAKSRPRPLDDDREDAVVPGGRRPARVRADLVGQAVGQRHRHLEIGLVWSFEEERAPEQPFARGGRVVGVGGVGRSFCVGGVGRSFCVGGGPKLLLRRRRPKLPLRLGHAKLELCATPRLRATFPVCPRAGLRPFGGSTRLPRAVRSSRSCRRRTSSRGLPATTRSGPPTPRWCTPSARAYRPRTTRASGRSRPLSLALPAMPCRLGCRGSPWAPRRCGNGAPPQSGRGHRQRCPPPPSPARPSSA